MTDSVFNMPGASTPNNFLHPIEITREYLSTLTNNLVMVKHCYKGYSENNYGNANPKEGDTLRVRLPNRFKSSLGAEIGTNELSSVDEISVPVQLTTRRKMALGATTQDFSLYIDDFNKLFLSPAATQMANDIDFDAADLYKDVYNCVGSATAIPSSLKLFLDAGTVLDNNSVARDGSRWATLTSATMGSMVDALKGLFQDSGLIGKQYRSGMLGITGGFQFEMSQNMKKHTSGNYGTSAELKVNMVEGSDQIVIDTFAGVSGTPSFAVGDIISIAGVDAVNMSNKQTVGLSQQFTIKSATWDSGNSDMTCTISPTPIASPTDPYQNVSALASAADTVSFEVEENTTYAVNLCFHEEAFCFVSANLPIQGGVDYGASETIEGVNTRILRQYQFMSDTSPTRMDVLYGMKTTRPEMAVRVISKE